MSQKVIQNTESENRSIGATQQSTKMETNLFSFQDNRPETRETKSIQSIISNTSGAKYSENNQFQSIQRVKRNMGHDQMSFSDDFTDRHLANNIDTAFTNSVNRSHTDAISPSTVIVANGALQNNLLQDFAEDYNDEDHGEHDNIVYSRPVTIAHTEYTGESEDEEIGAIHEYETEQWGGVVIGAGVATNVALFGTIGHLHSATGGGAVGNKYKTSFLEIGDIDWFRELDE